MYFVRLVAAVVLASTALPGVVAAAAVATASGTPTVRPWPCASGSRQFALRAIGQPPDPDYGENTTQYTGSWLGVLGNGTAPAARPKNKERPLWYLKDSSLYIAPGTTRFGQKLAGAPVIETAYATDGSDPKYIWYWQNWYFNTTTAPRCSNCSAVTCSIQPLAGAPDGVLACTDTFAYQEQWVALPSQSDAAVGMWESAAQAFGPPSPGGEIVWKVVPGCLLNKTSAAEGKERYTEDF